SAYRRERLVDTKRSVGRPLAMPGQVLATRARTEVVLATVLVGDALAGIGPSVVVRRERCHHHVRRLAVKQEGRKGGDNSRHGCASRGGYKGVPATVKVNPSRSAGRTRHCSKTG